MSALINHTYFVGELNIPNWQNTEGIREDINALVSTYEQKYLDAAMGAEFADLFRSGITDERFAKLVNGGVFTISGGAFLAFNGISRKAIRFDGLANNASKRSPIASLVYYWWQRKSATTSTNSGETITEPDKAVAASANEKAKRAWNDMVEQTTILHGILSLAVDTDGNKIYPEFDYNMVDTVMIQRINLFGI